MRTKFLTLCAVLAVVYCTAEVAHAQSRSSTSAFGSSGFGSSGMGGSSGFGSGGLGSSGFGSGSGSGFGSSGFGNSGFGSSSMGGFGNSGFGNSGFGGSQSGGGQNFVGRDATDMQATFMQSNRASTQFFNNMNRQMSSNNRRQAKSSSSKNPPQKVRIDMKVGFNPPRISTDAVAAKLRTRLAKILTAHDMSQPVVTMQGDIAVLSGTAASDSERAVIAQLVSLESGVREVRNEMTVAGAASEAIAPPAGS